MSLTGASAGFADQASVKKQPGTTLYVVTDRIPDGTQNTSYSVALVALGGTSTGYTWTVKSGSITGCTLSSGGVISGVPSVISTFTINVEVTDSDGNKAQKSFTMSVGAQPLVISTLSIPPAQAGVEYATGLVASGGRKPYIWSTGSGSTVTGLSAFNVYQDFGAINGVPISRGLFNFEAVVTDADGRVARATYGINVTASSLVLVTPTPLPGVLVGNAYSQAIVASGGLVPYTYALTSGTLPLGLAFNTTTGTISGTPTTAGTANFTVAVTDVTNTAVSQAYTLTVTAVVASVYSLYGYTVTGNNYNYAGAPLQGQSISGTNYDIYVTPTTNIRVDPNRVLSSVDFYIDDPLRSGAPFHQEFAAPFDMAGSSIAWDTNTLTNGQHSVTAVVWLTDNTSQIITSTFSVSNTVAPPTITTAAGALAGATVGVAYNVPITVTGSATPFAWAISVGALPAGLTLSSSTGVISGTPTTVGNSSFTVRVTDHNGSTATAAYTIATVAQPLTVQTVVLSSGINGTPYSQQIVAIGGTAPYSFALFSGTMIHGCTLSAGGLISGTPDTATSYSFTVRCTDSAGSPAHVDTSYNVTIAAAGTTDNYAARVAGDHGGAAALVATNFLSTDFTAGDWTYGTLTGSAGQVTVARMPLSWNPTDRHMFLDTTVAPAAGANSIRMEIWPTDTEHSNDLNFHIDDYSKQFGENSEVWFQFRQRFDANYLNTVLSGPSWWKQMFITAGVGNPNGGTYAPYPDTGSNSLYTKFRSCAELEIVMRQMAVGHAIPKMYHGCGGLIPSGTWELEWYYGAGNQYCHQNRGFTTGPFDEADPSYGTPNQWGAITYAADQWMTFMVCVKPGPWGSANGNTFPGSGYNGTLKGFTNSTIEVYIGYEGEPLQLAVRATGILLRRGSDVDAIGEWFDAKYGAFLLSNFCTSLTADGARPTMKTWYGQPIVKGNRPLDPAPIKPSYVP
jgi:hypothetical protein